MLTRPGQWTIVFVHLLQRDAVAGGVLLLDKKADLLTVKLLSVLPTDDQALRLFWSELSDDLVKHSAELGGEATLAWLEDTASHSIRIGRREEIQFADSSKAVEELFLTNVLHNRGQAATQAG